MTFSERPSRTDESRDAMRKIRSYGLLHLQRLVAERQIRWAFASPDRRNTLFLVEAQTLEAVDALVKSSPVFPHVDVECVPIIRPEAVAREIQASLGRDGAVPVVPDIPCVDHHRVPDPWQRYWLVEKEVPPVDPTVSEEAQRKMLERTVRSKVEVDPSIEFADLNVVGRMAGYLIGVGSHERVSCYVAQCATAEDIVWTIAPLVTLEQALATGSVTPMYSERSNDRARLQD